MCEDTKKLFAHRVVHLLRSVDGVRGTDAVRVALLLVLVVVVVVVVVHPVKLRDVVRDRQRRDLVVDGERHRVGLARGSWEGRVCYQSSGCNSLQSAALGYYVQRFNKKFLRKFCRLAGRLSSCCAATKGKIAAGTSHKI